MFGLGLGSNCGGAGGIFEIIPLKYLITCVCDLGFDCPRVRTFRSGQFSIGA